MAITVDTIETNKDNNWELLEFLDINSTGEIVPYEQDKNDLDLLPRCPELTNIESEEPNETDQETLTESVKTEEEEPPKRKRRRTATDCRMEWRAAIATEKAAIIENVDKITHEEMLLREKYGEMKGVVRVNRMNKTRKLQRIFSKEERKI